jgi:hypothetical protein
MPELDKVDIKTNRVDLDPDTVYPVTVTVTVTVTVVKATLLSLSYT